MRVGLLGITTNLLESNVKKEDDLEVALEDELQSLRHFSQMFARKCYSAKAFEDLTKESFNEQLIKRIIESGHHSVFEHVTFNFGFSGMPKALVMIFNNEKQYVTSEQSARYTVMKDVEPLQKHKYENWTNLLIPLIDKEYPKMKDLEERAKAIKKLAQENARYITSVFTSTSMGHTINWRQLNFLMYELEDFVEANARGDDVFKARLVEPAADFLSQFERFRIKGLRNQTDRHLSFFREAPVKEHFGDTYLTNYKLSFAALAQAQRHRTIDYSVFGGYQLGAPEGFFVPPLIEENDLQDKWVADLEEVARTDFPQAQLLNVSEMGILKDFKSKMILRLCGHAQYEIMDNVRNTANLYVFSVPGITPQQIKPKCLQKMKCKAPCVWSGKRALRRII